MQLIVREQSTLQLEFEVQSPLRALQIEEESGWPDLFGLAVRAAVRDKMVQPIPTLSLFTGAGGLDIGFHDVGFQSATMVELDQRFVRTLSANSGPNNHFATAEALCLDARQFQLAANTPVEFIIGGPPCQTFSAAGRRAGGVRGTTDERGTLFRSYVELLESIQPKGFLFENVYGITGANFGEDWAEITAAFKRAGYRIYFRILDSADYGVPQHRERMFIVGIRNDVGIHYRFPRPTHGPDSPGQVPYYSAGAALGGLPDDGASDQGVNGKYGHLLNDIPPGLNYSFYTAEMGHPRPMFAWRSKFSDFLYKADPDTPVRTIKAQGGQYTGPFHWANRPFAVAELKRLQTFPDDYLIVGGRSVALAQIGNSVPPQLARMLALSIASQLFGASLPFGLPLLEPHETLGFRKRKRLLSTAYGRKAAAALGDNLPATRPVVRDRTYRASLSEDFAFERDEAGKLEVVFRGAEDSWTIEVSDRTIEDSFEIDIRPLDKWVLPTKRILLKGSLTPAAFTSAWKAFELELCEQEYKADLVQLSGYYQYKPSISCTMRESSRDRMWRIIAEVVEGDFAGRVLPLPEARDTWTATLTEVWRICRFMRELGFEVRNSNTNPQLGADTILIPYSFPTLNPKSVQRHKMLGV